MTLTVGAEAWESGRPAAESARLGPTRLQYLLAGLVTLALAAALKTTPFKTAGVMHDVLLAGFALAALLRLGLTFCAVAKPPPPAPTDARAAQATYTVLVPLYDEAAMIPELLRALERLDHPRDRLQVILALEADDLETREAARRAGEQSPLKLEVVLSPLDGPRTKPKACNAALRRATGELVVVYDAEDRPDPGQLREAAARFAKGPADLGCLQAPLRIRAGSSWLQRQFALEYAALFEVMLPAYAALGLSFPLGGTSNHFRRSALDDVGGWDPWNVTEDADMGMRLAARRWRLGVLSLPTWESAPSMLAVWTPQRTRWVKGHMQTWGVHMRRPFAGGWRRALSLQITLGLSVVSSLLHGALAAGLVACGLVALSSWTPPQLSAADLCLLVGGWASAVLSMAVGARRAGARMRWGDALTAPAYWPLQSLAAIFSSIQLVACPFAWDKTPHEPEPAEA